MIEIELEQAIYSSVPGQTGNWAITRKVSLPAVPRTGDWVEPAEDWGLQPVRDAGFLLNGDVVVALQPITTDDPRRLAELDRLVAEHGWKQLGGPWANQSHQPPSP